jgi:hypothetical protein
MMIDKSAGARSGPHRMIITAGESASARSGRDVPRAEEAERPQHRNDSRGRSRAVGTGSVGTGTFRTGRCRNFRCRIAAAPASCADRARPPPRPRGCPCRPRRQNCAPAPGGLICPLPAPRFKPAIPPICNPRPRSGIRCGFAASSAPIMAGRWPRSSPMRR